MKLILTSAFLLGAGGVAVHATANAEKTNNTENQKIEDLRKIVIDRDMGTFMVTPQTNCIVNLEAIANSNVEETFKECVNLNKMWIKAI